MKRHIFCLVAIAILIFSLGSLTSCGVNRQKFEDVLFEAAYIHPTTRDGVYKKYQYFFTSSGLSDFLNMESLSTKDAELYDEHFFWTGNDLTMIAKKDNKTGQIYIVVGELSIQGSKIDSIHVDSYIYIP